jgi:DNA polymerase elongation subunit (family B)
MSWNIGPESRVQFQDLPFELRLYYDKHHAYAFLQNGVPEELTELLRKHNMCMTLNGQFYRTDVKGFIASTVADVFKSRKAEKSLMLDAEAKIEQLSAIQDKTDAQLKELEDLEQLAQLKDTTQHALKIFLNSLV